MKYLHWNFMREMAVFCCWGGGGRKNVDCLSSNTFFNIEFLGQDLLCTAQKWSKSGYCNTCYGTFRLLSIALSCKIQMFLIYTGCDTGVSSAHYHQRMRERGYRWKWFPLWHCLNNYPCLKDSYSEINTNINTNKLNQIKTGDNDKFKPQGKKIGFQNDRVQYSSLNGMCKTCIRLYGLFNLLFPLKNSDSGFFWQADLHFQSPKILTQKCSIISSKKFHWTWHYCLLNLDQAIE